MLPAGSGDWGDGEVVILHLEMQKVGNVWVWKDELKQHYTFYDEASHVYDHQLDAMHYMYQGLRKGSYVYTEVTQKHSWIKKGSLTND